MNNVIFMKRENMKNEISKDYRKAKETIEKGIQLLYNHCSSYDIFLDNISEIINNTEINHISNKTKFKDIYGKIVTHNDSQNMIKSIRESIGPYFY